MSEVSNPANTPAQPFVEVIVEPMSSNYDATTVYTYPMPPHGEGHPAAPDDASTAAFTTYMEERLEARAEGTLPTIVRYPVIEPATRKVFDRWILHPRTAMAIMAGTFLVSNMVGNAHSFIADTVETTQGLLHSAKERVNSALGRNRPTRVIVDTKVPGETIFIDRTYLESSGQSNPNLAEVNHLVTTVEGYTAQGGKVTASEVDGGTSDEWGRTADSLGVPNPSNQKLASKRAMDVATQLHNQDVVDGVADMPEIEAHAQGAENILVSDTIRHLQSEAAKYGLSLDEAVAIYNNHPEVLQPELRTALQTNIGDKRSVHVHIEIKMPDTMKRTVDEIEHQDIPPENKNHDYDLYWQALPVPPIWRRRKEGYLKEGYREWPRPGSGPDRRWVELAPEALEALDENSGVPNDLWRYTRKYLQLAREDRIDYVLTHQYVDADGKEQQMRVMFVDHDPTDATLKAVKEYLNDASQMKSGKIAERLSMVAIFPSSQAGIDKRYPQHVGIGVDKQRPSNILGTTTPALGLIEMHLAEDPTEAELHTFDGAMRTFTHELLGHGTDMTDEPTVLTPIGPAAVRHYVSSDPWTDVGKTNFKQYLNVDAKGKRHLEVTRKLVTKSGKVVTDTAIVTKGDRRLTEAHSARLLNRKPTADAGSSAGEMHAEIAAQAATDMEIPYAQTGMRVHTIDPDFAQGYGVDPMLLADYERHTGWSRKTARPVHENEFSLTLATDDPLVGDFIRHARANPMPQDRITILSGVRS